MSIVPGSRQFEISMVQIYSVVQGPLVLPEALFVHLPSTSQAPLLKTLTLSCSEAHSYISKKSKGTTLGLKAGLNSDLQEYNKRTVILLLVSICKAVLDAMT